ncbi:uncharacterized protein [Ptychodera flava]|uniref:uncharacterized protein n=1 Tax=Ptychodera flava TaxID=63121 RepID=UPI00396A9351
MMAGMKKLIALNAYLLLVCKLAVGLPEPVAFWPLNGIHLLKDVSGNGNHGIAGPDVQLETDVENARDGAYKFNGNHLSYVEFPNNGAYDTDQDLTIVMYVKPMGGDGTLFDFGNGQGVSMRAGGGSFTIQLRDRNGATVSNSFSTSRLDQNGWNFLGLTYKYAERGSTNVWVMEVGMGGMLAGQADLGTQHDVRMGAHPNSGGYLRAMVTCVKVFNAALTTMEMFEARQDCNMGRKESLNPVASWPLNKHHELRDVSGNGNHGEAGFDLEFDENVEGTKAGAYKFKGNLFSYIEFPNNGAYDTRRSTTLLLYTYPEWANGPIFSFKKEGTGVSVTQTPHDYQIKIMGRDGVLKTNVQTSAYYNFWNFVGFGYDYDTGNVYSINRYKYQHSKNIGQVELLTNDVVRMGAATWSSGYFTGVVTCVQVYDRLLTESEIFAASETCTMGSSSQVTLPPTAAPTPKPTTEKPTTAKPTTEKPTTEKPTTEKPTTAKPTTEKPTTPACTVPSGLANIALDKTASQISDAGRAVASRAVDGNKNSDFKKRSCSKTRGGPEPWWMVDLGSRQDVYQVTITSRQDCCANQLINAEVRVGDNPDDFTANSVCGVKVGANDVGKETIEIICDCGVPLRGRYVSVQRVGSRGTLTLCEVEVLADVNAPPITEKQCEAPSGLNNFALGKTASQSSDSGKNVASRAVDGDKNSDLAQKSCSKTGYEEDPWWIVDLGSSQDVYQVTITNRQDCCAEKLIRAEVRVGDKRVSFKKNAQCGAKIGPTDVTKETIDVICDCGAPVNGRFVSVQLVGVKAALTLCEVEVMTVGGAPPPPPTTEAVSEFTTAEPCELPENVVNIVDSSMEIGLSSTRKDNVASRAIDGNKDSNLAGGSCAMTQKEFQPVLKLDFGSVRRVHKVVLTNRQDCCGFRLKGVEARIGGSRLHTSNPVCGSVNNRRAREETVEIMCGCDVPMPGRYLSLQLIDKTQLLTVCEIEVFAAPQSASDQRLLADEDHNQPLFA